MDRRNFFKTLGVMGASTIGVAALQAEETDGEKEFVGVLVDTTRCVGCQTCSEACAEANSLPEPDLDAIDDVGLVDSSSLEVWPQRIEGHITHRVLYQVRLGRTLGGGIDPIFYQQHRAALYCHS